MHRISKMTGYSEWKPTDEPKLNPHLPMICKHFTYYRSFHKWLLSCFDSLQTVTEKISLKTLSLRNFTLSHLPSSLSAQ